MRAAIRASLLAIGLIALTLYGRAGAMAAARPAPEIVAQGWLNTGPLTLASLRSKVVLVEFWTFGCYNCRNVEPHVKAWHEKYAGQGLTVIGIHSPEFPNEREAENVKRYVREHRIAYAIAIDNDFITWERFHNQAWPALYLIDKHGFIRHVRIGEGGYAETDAQIRTLLAEE